MQKFAPCRHARNYPAVLGLLGFIIVVSKGISAHAGLTDRDVVRLLLAHNPDVQLAQLDCEIALAQKISASADFDWVLAISSEVKSDTRMTASATDDYITEENQKFASLGLKRKFALGTQLEASVQTVDIETSSTRSLLPLRTQSGFQLKLTQPLLRGVGAGVNLAEVQKAHAQLEQFEANFEEIAGSKVKEALSLYWDLIADEEEIKSLQFAIDSAKEAQKAAELKLHSGMGSRVDVLQSKATAALAQAKWINSKAKFENNKEQLQNLLLSSFDSFSAQPSSLPPVSTGITDIHDPSVKKSLATLKESEITHSQASNTLLPSLQLTLEASSAGLATDFGQSFRRVLDFSSPSYTATLIFSFPLGNNDSDGAAQETKATLEKNQQMYLQKKLESEKNKRDVNIQLALTSELYELTQQRKKNSFEKFNSSLAFYHSGKISLIDRLDDISQNSELTSQAARERANHEKAKLNKSILESGLQNWAQIEGCSLKIKEG